MINGILFRLRTGTPWHDVPAQYGPWKTVYERHRRWSADGTWDKILRSLLAHADVEDRIVEQVGIDSTSCRAHQHAAGAHTTPPRIPGRRALPSQHQPDEGMGRSRGGLTSKIHLVGEGGRRPLAFLITPGQWGDAPQLIPVLERLNVPRVTTGRPRMAVRLRRSCRPDRLRRRVNRT
jgi:transposase